MAAYGRRADRVIVRHRHGDVIAVIEVVSPGNKATAAECRSFVVKSADPRVTPSAARRLPTPS